MKELIRGKPKKDLFWEKYQCYFGGNINGPDDEDDQEFLKLVFKKLGYPNEVIFFFKFASLCHFAIIFIIKPWSTNKEGEI